MSITFVRYSFTFLFTSKYLQIITFQLNKSQKQGIFNFIHKINHMNLKCLFCILFITISFITSCKTVKYTPLTFEEEMISFGNFGGFTGEMDAYHLLSNGQLFKQEGRKKIYNEVDFLHKKEVKSIFEQYKSLKINDLKLNQPGNLSYFIEMKGANVNHKIIWSDESLQLNDEIVAFYKRLYDLTKTNS